MSSNKDGNLCTWKADKSTIDKCPHLLVPRTKKNKILANILENIGDTPLVRINNIAKKEGLTCELLVILINIYYLCKNLLLINHIFMFRLNANSLTPVEVLKIELVKE